MQIKEDRIGVFVRVRPYQEKQQNTTFILNQTTTEITLKDKQRDKDQDLRFTFDHVFPHQTTQQEVYEKVALPIVDAAFQGINGTVFAYGQTSSGKTFTCVGPDCQESNLKGILPRCVQSIFQRIGNSHNYLQFRIRVSMVQIYMQKINDLLDPLKIDLKIRQNKTKGIYIQDVTEEYVSSPQETIKVFKKGVNNRAVAFTNMNDFSSRSHMAFILTLHQNNLKDGSAKSAKITIVDLAGSEKVSKTMAQGKVLDEAKQINKSLSSLGNVINALIDIKTAHIPYRDSKLTRLLQQSLGGNSKTSLIINISPSSYNASQSISSLRFGFRAKDIKNRPKINKQYTIPELLLLLQKSQKRNQQLQILLRELTASINIKKQNKTAGEFVQNLLDSDNPIMSGIEDMEVSMIPSKRTSLKVVKKCYQSQVESQSQEEQPKTMRNKKLQRQQLQKQKQGLQQKHLQIVAQRDEQLSILAQQLNRINNQRVDLVRQLDICRERLELATKEARINTMKFNSEKKENENLLQNYIKENIQNQQKSETIAALHSKIVAFEEKFIKLNEIHNQTAKQNKVFGVSKNLNEQTSRILNEVLGEDEQLQDKQLKRQALQGLQKDKKIEELMTKVKQLETELCTFQHLEETKEDFIKQKIKFISERDRIYKDLENRIQKVLELQERLDQEKQKRKYLEELINMDESDKIRKIQSLERHISSVSQEYYVLKGQQSSWKKSNEKLQKKYGQLTKKILQLESENLQLKVEIENLRMQCIELQAINDNRSELDVEFSEVQETNFRGNIVKVVRSNIFQVE